MDTTVIYYNDKVGAEAMKRAKVGLFDRKYRAYHTRWRSRVNVGLETPDGKALPYVMAGQKPVFLGKKGQPYVVTIENKTKGRLEVVVSVDGLDVLDGKPASPKKMGYVVNGKETLRIKGFRRSTSQVAQFEFSSVGGSYANQTGGESAARNIGVMGVATFTEREAAESVRRKGANAFPGGFATPPPTR